MKLGNSGLAFLVSLVFGRRDGTELARNLLDREGVLEGELTKSSCDVCGGGVEERLIGELYLCDLEEDNGVLDRDDFGIRADVLSHAGTVSCISLDFSTVEVPS